MKETEEEQGQEEGKESEGGRKSRRREAKVNSREERERGDEEGGQVSQRREKGCEALTNALEAAGESAIERVCARRSLESRAMVSVRWS